MATVQITIRSLANSNNNNVIQWPFKQGHKQFFTDCQDAFNSQTQPSILLRFSQKSLGPAIILCYALHHMELHPLEASNDANSTETVLTANHVNSTLSLNETAEALKLEIENLIANLGSDLAFMQDLRIEIKECTKKSPLLDDTDGLSSSSGVSSEKESPSPITLDLGLTDQNRFLLACKKCYNLKPPIIIQQSGNSCSWCETNETILLHEVKNVVDDTLFVEYSVIREFNKNGGVPEDCNTDEEKVWQYLIGNDLMWQELTAELSQYFSQDDTATGCFHCPICSENFTSNSKISSHWDSPQHRQMTRCLDVNRQKWKYRQLPNLKGNYYLCTHTVKERECPNGDTCEKAHAEEELDEWKKRFSIIKEKLKFAKENHLLSFAEQISQEYEEERSSAAVLTDSLDEVSCKVRPSVFQRCPTNNSLEWMVKLNCQDTHNKLSHVALLQKHGTDYFKVCKVRGKKQGQFTSHIDYTTSADDSYSMLHGIAKFKVKFQAPKPGTFSEVLVFEFLKMPRPALMVKFNVLVGDNISIADARPEMPQLDSWERRQIVPFSVDIRNDFENTLKELTNKYKPPEVSLDYIDDDADLNSKSLTKENYVTEMHRFLYREEAARKQAISKVYCSCKIGLTDNYYSLNGGLCFTDGKGGLFGIFQLPGFLNRDTDEGLLVLENCQMVLLSQKGSDQNSIVYETKLESKASDHAVLSISKKCVCDWGLRSGMLIECDLQFQLDRRLFCMSHCALDQLPELDRLSIVCPDPPPPDLPFPVNRNATAPCRELDPHQIRVLQHLTTDNVAYPLFAVVGPFGTGKTYTISQCVLFLLKHYSKAKILVCTHSNSAADLYIQNNFRGEEWNGKIIRVYYHDRIIKSVPEEVRRFCLMDENHTTFRYPTAKEILPDKVRVVITTFATALVLGLKATGLHGVFNHIFLDEAAQAMECEAIIPLTLASTNGTRVIVAGDHMQISQKVYSKKFGSESDYTLVERMYTRYRTFNKSTHNQLLAFLTHNYRCVEPILNLIEAVFYKRGLLKSCTTEKLVPGLLPVQFFHIQGNCQKDYASGGFYNLDEATLVVFAVQELLQHYSIQEIDIVVVSSYSVQVKHMRSLLRKEGYRYVNVSRVRDIQGREYKVVIMCGVHCRKSATDEIGSKTGLLADVGLLNTAITRSKVAVIAIGDAVTLCSIGVCHSRWHAFVETCSLSKSLLPRHESLTNILHQVNRFSKLNPEAQGFVPRKKKISQRSKSGKPTDSPSSSRSSQRETSYLDQDPVQQDDELFESDDDETSEDDLLALVDDKILDDILERQLGYRPDKATVKVDQGGLEYLDTMESDPNEPGPNLRHHSEHRPVIYDKFTVGQLLKLLRDNPKEYKHCFLSMMSWYSAEAILKEPEGDLIKISLDTRRSIGRAFNKDEVVVHISQNSGKVVTGKVIGVLQRYKEPRTRDFVCIPDEFNPAFMCPIDYKVTKFAFLRKKGAPWNQIPIYKPVKDDLKFVRNQHVDPHAYNRGGGKLFIVRYLCWSEYCPYPLGYVSKVIAASDAESYIAITYDRPSEHKQDMENQCKGLKDENVDLRSDRTELYTFTIDPPGSKDLDDALSIEKCTAHSNCYQIGIHIADVASVVPAQSKVDKEARHRATTFYDPEVMKERRKNSPMLPRYLSSDKCSLLADGKAKPAISTFFHTSQLLDISDPDFKVPTPKLTTIKSKRQMSYREAEELLRQARVNPEEMDLNESSDNTLPQQLYLIWRYLMELRVSRLGTAVYHQQSNSQKLQEFFDEGPAHMLIEEAMITLNACTAIFLRKKRCNFLLRCQDPPLEEESKDWLIRYDSQIQLSLSLKSNVNHLNEQLSEDLPTPRNALYVLPELLTGIEAALDRGDLEAALILFSCDELQPSICPARDGFVGIQKRATLQESSRVDVNLPSSHSHFSLRLPFYSWCSSPIRRYTDIIAQRQIIKMCKKSNEPTRKDDVIVLDTMVHEKSLNETCKQLSLRQNDAKDYERELMQFTLAKLFQNQQERSYQQAIVTEVTNKEIKFSLVGYSNLRRISVLPYTHLFARKATWGEQVNSKFSRPGEKILKSNHLIWHIRYYDLRNDKSKTRRFQHSHFQHTVVSAQMVKELVENMSSVITSGSAMGDETSENITAHLKRIVKTQKPTQQCPAKASKQLGPCDGPRCNNKDSTCGDHMSFQTKNDIRHVRVISTLVESGLPILVQLNPRIKRGMLEPTVQLLCLAEDFDVCLSHQTDAIETFASDARPTSVHGNYETMKKYALAWLPVLRLDGVFTAVNDGFSITFEGVQILWTKPGEGYFSLNTKYCKERIIHMHIDGFLCIRVKNVLSSDQESRYTWVMHARILNVDENEDKDKQLTEVTFELCESILSKDDSENPVCKHKTVATVEYIPLHIPHKRMAKSLHHMRKGKIPKEEMEIVKMLCVGDTPQIDVPNHRDTRVQKLIDSVGQEVRGFNFPLNQKQKQQVQKAMRNKLTLIQGPPGTGKSFMGAYMVHYFRQMNIATGNSGLILYCGPSNKSVDVVAEYLMKTGIKILRVYGKMMEELDYPNPLNPALKRENEANPSAKLHSITLHKIIRNETNSKHKKLRKFDKQFLDKRSRVTLPEYMEYKSVVQEAKEEEVTRHDVIICTCTAAAMKILRPNGKSKHSKLKQMLFSHCIIDEAGMCSEPETLVPIITSLANQVVLIGDHKQLQPVIQCERARDFGMGRSMFERLEDNAEMLTLQYRMNETICDFPSQHFYRGELTTDDSVIKRDSRNPGVLFYPDSRPWNTAIFAHTESEEDNSFNKLEHGGVNSKYNKGQARAVIKILVWLHLTKRVPLEDIMILSPYKAQCAEITSYIKTERSTLSAVHVGTVVTSQGSERDYVILSTVRSQPQELMEESVTLHWRRKYLGFVTDPHQINVAITRARRGLCIIGNRHTLDKDLETWHALLQNYYAKDSVVDFVAHNAPWNCA